MHRAQSICNHPGCSALIPSPGYCSAHTRDTSPRGLDNRKTAEQKKFYSSYAWTMASRRYRAKNPLCAHCRKKGIVEQGVLVHHNPAREELLKKGLNPLNEIYLETLCWACHQRELRGKK